MAVDTVESPHVERGEAAVEYSGIRTFDRSATRNDVQENEFAISYGLTGWWETELNGVLAKEAEGSARLIGIEFENKFQLAQPKEYWADPGLLIAYTFGTHDQSDELKTQLLLEKQTGQFVHRLNAGFTKEIGNNVDGDFVPLLSWSTRYQLHEQFQPGLEIQSSFGHRDSEDLSKHERYVGPALYGEILPHVNYEAAYLFGLTNEGSNSAARVQIEYEMNF
jgi:hypothetical protein